MKFSQLITTTVLLGLLGQLSGCAAIIVAGATGAASAADDRRSIGAQIDDNSIEVKAALALSKSGAISDHTHISIFSVNGNLLAVGQAPNELLRNEAITVLNQINGVKRVHNQIRITSVTSMLTRTNDTWLTSKVKLKLLGEKSIRSNNIKVVTENAEVYLMGLVTRPEADKAAEIVRNVAGVAKVIKMFEVL